MYIYRVTLTLRLDGRDRVEMFEVLAECKEVAIAKAGYKVCADDYIHLYRIVEVGEPDLVRRVNE